VKNSSQFFSLARFENLLYYYSATDVDLINQCSTKAKNTRKAIGATVLLSAVIACVSASFFFYMIFESILLTLVCGFFYFLVISNFDRSLFVASSKWLGVIRLGVVVLIALITSVAFEVRLFMKDLNRQQEVRAKQEEAQLFEPVAELDGERRRLMNEYDQKIANLEREYAKMKQLRDAEAGGIVVSQSGSSSSGIQGKGKRWRSYNQQMINVATQLENVKQQKQDIEGRYIQDVTKAEQLYERKIVKPADSFLSKYIALKDLLNSPDDKVQAATKEINYGIKLFIFLIETFPILLKLFLPKTLYEYQLEQQDDLVAKALESKNSYVLKNIEDTYAQGLSENYSQEEIEEKIESFSRMIHKINLQYS